MTVCCTCTLLCKLFLSGFQPCCIAEHDPLSQVEVFLKCRKCYSGPRVCQVAYWMSTLREQVLNKITFFFLLKRTTVWWTIIFVRSINRYFTPKSPFNRFFLSLCHMKQSQAVLKVLGVGCTQDRGQVLPLEQDASPSRGLLPWRVWKRAYIHMLLPFGGRSFERSKYPIHHW